MQPILLAPPLGSDISSASAVFVNVQFTITDLQGCLQGELSRGGVLPCGEYLASIDRLTGNADNGLGKETFSSAAETADYRCLFLLEEVLAW